MSEQGTYDKKTLRKLQLLEVEMLKDFQAVCEKNGIPYFGIGGTQIGTLRHKGFIPWDDDIDIGMLREDYERFLQVAEEQMSEKYRVINAERYEHYPLVTTHLALRGTKFVPEFFEGIDDVPFGVFLDLFPFDNMPEDDKAAKKQAFWAWFWGKLLILANLPFPYVACRGVKKKIIHGITGICHGVMKLFHISPKWLYQKSVNQCKKYNDMETQRVNYFCDTSYMANIIRRDEIFPLEERVFEDIMVKFPNNMHNQLKALYGDYMKLPPVEARKNHLPVVLDFGPYEDMLEQKLKQ